MSLSGGAAGVTPASTPQAPSQPSKYGAISMGLAGGADASMTSASTPQAPSQPS